MFLVVVVGQLDLHSLNVARNGGGPHSGWDSLHMYVSRNRLWLQFIELLFRPEFHSNWNCDDKANFSIFAEFSITSSAGRDYSPDCGGDGLLGGSRGTTDDEAISPDDYILLHKLTENGKGGCRTQEGRVIMCGGGVVITLRDYK